MACYLYMRRRYSLDPAAVYRLAMLRLNTDPGLLEVMGAPLAGGCGRGAGLLRGRLGIECGSGWGSWRGCMVWVGVCTSCTK